MKNFKAKALIDAKYNSTWTPDTECVNCNETKTCIKLATYWDDYENICLDCLQYTETQERIEQLESYLYPEAKEFENNETKANLSKLI